MQQKVDNLREMLYIQNPVGSTTTELDSLLSTKSELERCLTELNDALHQRKQQTTELLAEQATLCEELGEIPTYTLPTETLPSADDIKQFRQHLDTLRHTKMMRLQQINEIRSEIIKMQKTLGINLTIGNEEYPVLHEEHPKLNSDTVAILRRILKHYSKQIEYRQIYELYKKRLALCDRLAALLLKPNDSARYHNRGGQLLKEEKERKALSALLTKVEPKLEQLVQQYEELEGEPFLIDGQNIRKLMLKQYPKTKEQNSVRLEQNLQKTQIALPESEKKCTKLIKQNSAKSVSDFRVPQHLAQLKRTHSFAQCAIANLKSFAKPVNSPTKRTCPNPSKIPKFVGVRSSNKEQKTPIENSATLEKFMTGIKASSRSTLLPNSER